MQDGGCRGQGAEAPSPRPSPAGRGGKANGETSIISLQGPGRNRPGSGETGTILGTENLTVIALRRSLKVHTRPTERFILILRHCQVLSVLALLSPVAFAQTVRFETNAGNFDLVLNPTDDSRLQGSVDNLLQYVTSGRYDNTVINRAETDFVVQMGLYKATMTTPPHTAGDFVSIDRYPPIHGVPANTVGLSNTLGTVGFAALGTSHGTDRNSATSSFYINLTNNSFLDEDFTIFGIIPDMTTISAIVALPHVDLTADPNFGADRWNFDFNTVPLLPNANLVVISRAFVIGVPEPCTCVLFGYFTPLFLLARGMRQR